MPVRHPDGCYWVQPVTGTIQRQCNPLLAGALGQVGFVGQNGQTPGFGGHAFVKFTDAEQFAHHNNTPQRQIRDAGQKLADLGGINAIGDFFNRLTQANTWIRVGEVVAGLLLVYLGLSATMRGTEAQRQVTKARSVAKKAVAVAAK